ncbi:TPA: DNA/RNA non-specific endonuclease, partial [Bacillus cereus]
GKTIVKAGKRLGEGVTMVAGKAGKAAVDGIKTASHKVTEGVNFVASTAKGFADKIGNLWNKGATTVKTTFLQGNEKIQHAVKTLLEYKWIPGEGKGFAIAGVGNVSGGGQYSLKEAYQYMESKVVKGTGKGSKAVDDVVKDGSHFLDEFKLKPNVKYETNGYLYQTDELGRIERASGELTLEMGERNSKHQLAAGGEDRVKAPSTQGDHGGHLIGTQFNGSPLIDNIVAMNGNVNVSAYKKLESAWAKALRDKREVIVDIRPVYEGNSVRPVSFNIKYRIDGEKFKASLKNVYGGK